MSQTKLMCEEESFVVRGGGLFFIPRKREREAPGYNSSGLSAVVGSSIATILILTKKAGHSTRLALTLRLSVKLDRMIRNPFSHHIWGGRKVSRIPGEFRRVWGDRSEVSVDFPMYTVVICQRVTFDYTIQLMEIEFSDSRLLIYPMFDREVSKKNG